MTGYGKFIPLRKFKILYGWPVMIVSLILHFFINCISSPLPLVAPALTSWSIHWIFLETAPLLNPSGIPAYHLTALPSWIISGHCLIYMVGCTLIPPQNFTIQYSVPWSTFFSFACWTLWTFRNHTIFKKDTTTPLLLGLSSKEHLSFLTSRNKSPLNQSI